MNTPVADFFEANPDAWIKGAAARNAEGDIVNTSDPTACKWCVLGRMIITYPGNELRDKIILLRTVLCGPDISPFNDAAPSVQTIIDACRKAGV